MPQVLLHHLLKKNAGFEFHTQGLGLKFSSDWPEKIIADLTHSFGGFQMFKHEKLDILASILEERPYFHRQKDLAPN